RLRAWLKAHPIVNQKRLDACAMLERMRTDALSGASIRHDIEFEYTDAWHVLRKHLDERSNPTFVPHVNEAVTRLQSTSHARDAATEPFEQQRTWTLALERKVALLLAQLDPAAETPSQTEVQAASEAFRRAKGLETPE